MSSIVLIQLLFLNIFTYDDKIFHSGIISPTASDGRKDIINCGPGKDEAFINTRVDADIATNCETVHAG
jgi:hypothetical protein